MAKVDKRFQLLMTEEELELLKKKQKKKSICGRNVTSIFSK